MTVTVVIGLGENDREKELELRDLYRDLLLTFIPYHTSILCAMYISLAVV